MPTKTKKKAVRKSPFILSRAEDVAVIARKHHVLVAVSLSSARRADTLASITHSAFNQFALMMTRSWRTWKGSGELRAVFATQEAADTFTTKVCRHALNVKKPKAKAKVANG